MDRAVCNALMELIVSHMGVINGEMTKLDHRLMVIDTKYYVEVHQMGGAEGDLKLGGYRKKQ